MISLTGNTGVPEWMQKNPPAISDCFKLQPCGNYRFTGPARGVTLRVCGDRIEASASGQSAIFMALQPDKSPFDALWCAVNWSVNVHV